MFESASFSFQYQDSAIFYQLYREKNLPTGQISLNVSKEFPVYS